MSPELKAFNQALKTVAAAVSAAGFWATTANDIISEKTKTDHRIFMPHRVRDVS